MSNRLFQILCVFLVSLALVSVSHSFTGFFGHHKKVKAADGEIRIPIQSVNDGKAHHYVYSGQDQEVKFFVVKSADGVIRAAFDACDVCFKSKKGYSQDGEFMICNNCGRKFHSNRINVVKGGCNPAPLQRMEKDNYLVIQVADVLKGAKYF